MKHSYRAAVVGLGNIAWHFDHKIGLKENFLTHAYSYIHDDKTTLVGGCSPDENDRHMFQEAFDVPTFDFFEELVDRVAPDIVSICSPSKFHFEQVMCCLKRNVPMIWLEKPPACSVQELDRLLEKLSQPGKLSKVIVNYQRRYAETYQKLRAMYLEKTLGECRLIQLNYSRGLEINGSHMIDMLFFIAGDGTGYELDWVSSFGDWENPSFAITLDSGLGVMISGIELPYHCVDISLICEHGRASVLHGGMTPVVEERVEHELFPGFYRLKESKNDYLGSSGSGNSMEKALEDLIRSYEQGEEPQSSLWSARNAQALIEQVRQRQRNSDL